MSRMRTKKRKSTKIDEETTTSVPLKQGPPVFFSKGINPATARRVRFSVMAACKDGKPLEMEMTAGVSIPGLPGAGFIHLHPTADQIDEIVDALQKMKEEME